MKVFCSFFLFIRKHHLAISSDVFSTMPKFFTKLKTVTEKDNALILVVFSLNVCVVLLNLHDVKLVCQNFGVCDVLVVAILKRELEKQREELVAEFNTERASHQKMLGEYTRLEQRFTNLQEELKIEKNSPEKRRRSTVNSGTIFSLCNCLTTSVQNDAEFKKNFANISEEVVVVCKILIFFRRRAI